MVERIGPQKTNGHLGADVATIATNKEGWQEQVLSRANALGLEMKKRRNEKGEPENHYKVILPGKLPLSPLRIIYQGWAPNGIEALRYAIETLESEYARKQAKLLLENLSVQLDFSSHRLPFLGPKYTVDAQSTAQTWERVLQGRFKSTEHAEKKALKKIVRINQKRQALKNRTFEVGSDPFDKTQGHPEPSRTD